MLVCENSQPTPTAFRYVGNVPPRAFGPQFGQSEPSKLATLIRPVLPGLLVLAAVAAVVAFSGTPRRRRARR